MVSTILLHTQIICKEIILEHEVRHDGDCSLYDLQFEVTRINRIELIISDYKRDNTVLPILKNKKY